MLNSGWPVLGLLWLLLAAAPAGAASAAEPQPRAATNSLQAVDYALLPAGAALIRVVFTQPLQAPPGLVVSHHPINRIAFDFPDTVSAAGKQPIEVGQRGLRSIQVVQAGTRTRLVLKLDRPFVFETSLEGKELLITLRRPRSGAVRDAMRGLMTPLRTSRGTDCARSASGAAQPGKAGSSSRFRSQPRRSKFAGRGIR